MRSGLRWPAAARSLGDSRLRRPLAAVVEFDVLARAGRAVPNPYTVLVSASAWETPAAWVERNHQDETTLHNLLDMNELVSFTQAVALVFGVGTAALLALAAYRPRSVCAPLAPSPALAPLAALAVYSGLFWPAEIVELLLAVFFTYYGYRIMLAARSTVSAPHSG